MTVRETGRAPVTASVTAPVTASVTAAHIRDKMVHAKGKVERLFVHRDGLSIRLAGTKLKPKHEYFNLPLTHPNYNALFSLASMAAMSERVLRIRTVEDITPTEYAEVEHMVLDF